MSAGSTTPVLSSASDYSGSSPYRDISAMAVALPDGNKADAVARAAGDTDKGALISNASVVRQKSRQSLEVAVTENLEM